MASDPTGNHHDRGPARARAWLRPARMDEPRAGASARRADGGAPHPRPPRPPDAPRDPAVARRVQAAHRRSPRPAAPDHAGPRPRVEVTVNELTGTMSWRTLDRSAPASGAGDGNPRTPHRRMPGHTAPWSARAAALRSAGLDPSRAPGQDAAPIATHPAAVRAALSTDVAALTPEARRSHLARLGALRSEAVAGLAESTRMPTAVAARLRSTTATPTHTHVLATRGTATTTHPPAYAPAYAPGARPHTPAATAHRPQR
ncbi:hypothetical protein [Streptomyces deccanensis]|uniref:hypothetical protein n=1 Tax=Streptomyces deccanensis TaxID=424188 RepID=UPI001EFA5541|nr:hypothetical protein [Streptomyces deccanensis]ULR52768.1 hypothetical protein L3078_27770 [Streptomyces deccanensis]